MPSLFSRLKSKERKGRRSKDTDGNEATQKDEKPQWSDNFARTYVEPRETQELIHLCTVEIKARALELPFILLPFRPTSDPSGVRTFVRNFYGQQLSGHALAEELRMAEPMVVTGVLKWCWARLKGGVVGWDVYELFTTGETDSNMSRDAFNTFIPLSVENDSDRTEGQARANIIFDFFDLMASVAAHSKTNGLGARKLSRMAAWWAFEHKDTGSGFDGGYKNWIRAADATSHLFFAYLRSMSSPEDRAAISMLPRSLQKLLQETEYPPHRPTLLQSTTYKVCMIVNSVSPTPFSLLRRTNHFHYRDSDRPLQDFSEHEDPVQALTEECRRVLRAISSANQSQVSSSKHSTSLRDASWSRFEDIGFSSTLDEEEEEEREEEAVQLPIPPLQVMRLRDSPASGSENVDRPVTPSWADFLSSGFAKDGPTNVFLPPDKALPPIDISMRQNSSESHKTRLDTSTQLEPGELASISKFDLDEAFWWVWISSLAPEETADRKGTFGRCAVIETNIKGGRWLVMEEVVQGAAPEPDLNASYIAEKKSFFSWTKRGKGLSRRKSNAKSSLDKHRNEPSGVQSHNGSAAASKTSIAPDQQAKIHAAAQQLQARSMREQANANQGRRGRSGDDNMSSKTASVMTLQPFMLNEASPALQWASQYDRQNLRELYLGNAASSLLGGPPPTGETGSVVSEKPLVDTVDVQANTATPTPPPKDEPRAVLTNNVTSPSNPLPETNGFSGGGSPLETPAEIVESKKRGKLIKEKDKHGGFRKLFGRKNRNEAKSPEHDPEIHHSSTKPAATAAAAASAAETPLTTSAASTPQQLDSPHSQFRQDSPHNSNAIDIAAGNDSQRLPAIGASDAVEERESTTDFSRFDQGPLTDQPAFMATEYEDDQNISPPRSPEDPSVPEQQPLSYSESAIDANEHATSPVKSKLAPSLPPAVASESNPNNSMSKSPSSAAARTYQHAINGGDTSAQTTPTRQHIAGLGHPAYSGSPDQLPSNRAGRSPPHMASSPDGGAGSQARLMLQQQDPPQLQHAGPIRLPRPQRHASNIEQSADPASSTESRTAGSTEPDRWAQIRKQAAERVAQRQPDRTAPIGKPIVSDAEVEESIEARVARIKARVAELTNNMDDFGGAPNRPSAAPVHR